MKNTCLTLLLFVCIHAFGQEQTTKIKLKTKDKDGFTAILEYYALKADTSIRHGEYKRYNIIKNLEETGYYDHGVKSGVWKTYSGGKMVNSVGNYVNGKKDGLWNYYKNIPGGWKPRSLKFGNYSNDSLIGVWTYYYETSEIEQKYDHTLDSLIYRAKDKDKRKLLVKEGNQEVSRELDIFPSPVGGEATEHDNFYKMDHSKLLRLAKDETDLSYVLTFWIKPNGETYGYIMVKGVNTEHDNYIIEHYKTNYKWIPGVINDKNIECQYVVKVIDVSER